jgi:hypothetical protein
MAINQYFRLSLAALQRARPFQKRDQAMRIKKKAAGKLPIGPNNDSLNINLVKHKN